MFVAHVHSYACSTNIPKVENGIEHILRKMAVGWLVEKSWQSKIEAAFRLFGFTKF